MMDRRNPTAQAREGNCADWCAVGVVSVQLLQQPGLELDKGKINVRFRQNSRLLFVAM